jgi:hypothetical protein
VKVSLHEQGPARWALTSEFVRKGTFQVPEGSDPRLAADWERPRPKPPLQIARPLAIIVPSDEVLEREVAEKGDVTWSAPPPDGTCVHFDIVYTPAGATITGHPGARSMGTELVGEVELENGEHVFVTSIVREMEDATRTQVVQMRSAKILDAEGNLILDAEGNLIQKTGMLAFGYEPNPDADDGTFVGTIVDVTRPDEVRAPENVS